MRRASLVLLCLCVGAPVAVHAQETEPELPVIDTGPEGAPEAPAEEAPAELVPVGDAPSVDAPADGASPVEVPADEAPPVEAPPVEAAPVEASPAEARPAEARPAEARPAEARPAEVPPRELPRAQVTPPLLVAAAAPVERSRERRVDELDDIEDGDTEAEPDEEEALVREELPEPPQEIFLHGFRLGYLYVHGIEEPLDPRDPDGQRYWERYDMRAPHLFMIGYEVTWRMIGYDWLNVLVTGNILIAGLEQSRFFPSLNLILGFEAAQTVQVGVGVSLTPTKEEPAHMLIAAGFTPRIGSFYLPVHAFFVPDMNGHHKIGLTVGVNFF